MKSSNNLLNLWFYFVLGSLHIQNQVRLINKSRLKVVSFSRIKIILDKCQCGCQLKIHINKTDACAPIRGKTHILTETSLGNSWGQNER